MKTVVGTVVSDKMDKTISVREERMVKHRMYGKYVRRATVYRAHDESNQAEIGDRVEILFTRPLSKSKSWRLLRILRKARGRVEEDEASATAPAPSEQPPEPEPQAEAEAETEAEAVPMSPAEAAEALDSAFPGEAPAPEAEKPEEGAAS